MKSIIFIIIVLLQVQYTMAQVTIGADVPPHESAVLELISPNKGFLGPRVQLTGKEDVVTISFPADGLLVYNLRDAGTGDDKVIGDRFYYWSKGESKWVDFVGQTEIDIYVKEELTKIGIPRPAIFTVNGTDDLSSYGGGKGINNFLSGYGTGTLQELPLKETLNYTEENVTLDITKKKLTFKPGVYSITFSYEVAAAPGNNCNNSSYFMDFPIEVELDRARIHSNAYHKTNTNGNHAGIISYVAVLTKQNVWTVALGCGQAGDCVYKKDPNKDGLYGLSGFALTNGSYLYVSRIADVKH